MVVIPAKAGTHGATASGGMGSSLRACEEIGVLFTKPSLRGAERRSNPGARGTPHAVRWIAPAFAGAGFAARNGGLEDRFFHKPLRWNDNYN
jgi:hypothetical protein